MNNGLWTVAVLAGLVLVGCGDHHGKPAASTPPGNTSPTDFVSFVNQQVSTQPAFGIAPMSTASLTTDLDLGNATAFGSVAFGTGDALPVGTNQAVVACTQAGKTVCDPTSSADLNSKLN